MIRQLRPALVALALLTLATGIVYPLGMTAVAQLAMPGRADGSIVTVDGRPAGSALLAQPFDGPTWFHPRPSAAGSPGAAYDAAASGGSNLGPTNPELLATIAERAGAYRRDNGLADGTEVPIDAVTASGSGLDPDISPANARLQAPRVAASRGLPLDPVLAAIDAATRGRTAGVLGQPRVNVVELNAGLAALGA